MVHFITASMAHPLISWLLVGLGAITLRLGAAQPYPFCSSSLAIVDTITLSAAAGPGAYQELFTATCPSSGFGSVYTIYYGTTATGAVASTLYSSVASATIPCNGTTVTTYTYPAAGTFTATAQVYWASDPAKVARAQATAPVTIIPATTKPPPTTLPPSTTASRPTSTPAATTKAPTPSSTVPLTTSKAPTPSSTVPVTTSKAPTTSTKAPATSTAVPPTSTLAPKSSTPAPSG